MIKGNRLIKLKEYKRCESCWGHLECDLRVYIINSGIEGACIKSAFLYCMNNNEQTLSINYRRFYESN